MGSFPPTGKNFFISLATFVPPEMTWALKIDAEIHAITAQ
jgi:hypothetical protein